MKLIHRKTKGFTLVELLVVIAIIAVLAALATPAILSGIERARVTRATSICNAFETAVISFENEYNYLPYGGGGNAPDDDNDTPLVSNTGEGAELMGILAGIEDEFNFKEIRYFELDEPTGNKDGLRIDEASGTAELFDPWGEGYLITMDYNFDGLVENPFDNDGDVSRKTVIYSLGGDKDSGTTALNKDNASNFE